MFADILREQISTHVNAFFGNFTSKYHYMSVNYVSDSFGETIAVQISISDWKKIKDKYPGVDDIDNELPQWEKDMIDKRLAAIANDPNSIEDIAGLFDELDKKIG